MTTWDNADITDIFHNRRGILKELIYTINGVNGDTGGTLTTTFDHIKDIAVQVQTDAGAGWSTALIYAIVNNTVVVAYTDTTTDHTVRITVTGK